MFDMDDVRQGIVHIIGPEQGFTLPGMTIVCGDSHTATHGAFGALAFGIGTSEVEHVLATQTLIQKKSKNMRITVDGELPPGVTAKDIILAIIGEIGTAGGTGHVIEYGGEAIRALSMEGRMTVCNMTIEGGARAGLIAPDEKTFDYLKGRPMAPKARAWEQAVAYWRTLPSDEGATYDKEVTLDAADIAPQVTWGTSPEDVVPITGARCPTRPTSTTSQAPGHGAAALDYMGLTAGTPMRRHPHRQGLHRLLHQRPHRGPARRSPRSPKGRKVADGVHAMIVPGLGPGQGTGGGRGPRPHLHRGRLRLARARLLHVPGHERRQAGAGRALRLHVEPQLRGPPGPRRAHPPGQPGHGGGGRGQRHAGRRARRWGRYRCDRNRTVWPRLFGG